MSRSNQRSHTTSQQDRITDQRPMTMAAPEGSVASSGCIKKFNSELTEDLLFEILLRLSIKELSRCKTVCKKWLTLISSHSFAFRNFQIQTLRRQRMRTPFFVLCSLVSDAFFAPVSFSASRELIHPYINLPYIEPWFGSIWFNGMVSYELFPAGYGIYCLFKFLTREVLLWNPTTKEHKVLPPSPYDPSSKLHSFSFGTVDYKDGNFSYIVGRVTSNSIYTRDKVGHVSVSLELYSSKTKSWKVIPDFASGKYLVYSDRLLHCANLNGRAHWVFQSSTEDTYITTFDYETELFGRIKGPSPPQIGRGYSKLRCLVTTFDDKFLCLGLYRVIHGKRCYIEMWVMREYGDEDSWTKEFTVGPIPDDVEVLGFSSKLKGLFLRHTIHSPTVLIFWNCKLPNTKSYYSMTDRRIVKGSDMQVVEHVESLVSVLK